MSRSDHGCAYFHVLGHFYLGTHRFKHWNPHRSGTWSGLRMAEQYNKNSSLPTVEQSRPREGDVRKTKPLNTISTGNQLSALGESDRRRRIAAEKKNLARRTRYVLLLFVCLFRLRVVDVDRPVSAAGTSRRESSWTPPLSPQTLCWSSWSKWLFPSRRRPIFCVGETSWTDSPF